MRFAFPAASASASARVAVLCALSALLACAQPSPTTPTASTTSTASTEPAPTEPPSTEPTAAELAHRGEDVIDARTRPEPHPNIAHGTKLTAYVGPRFVTGEEFMPEAKVVVADETGRIRLLMRNIPKDNPYPVVTLPGALAVAGLHDAHLHIEGIGQGKENLDLLGTSSTAELKQKVAAFAKAHPSLSVIRGRGWDQSRFKGQAFPTAADLEGATALPVMLSRVDGHAVLVNRALLEKAKITKDTPDPAGGRILRDKAGAPTGVLVDNAIDLVTPHLPAPTDGDRRRWLTAGLDAAADAGLVAVHDMGMELASAKVLLQMDQEGVLPVRVFVYLDGTKDESYEFLGTQKNSEKLYFMGVKLYADGALGSRGAALIDDYSDEPGKKGLMLTEPAVLEQRIQRVHQKGYQAAIHAIGDGANRIVIDLLVKHHATDIRDRVEHAQVMHPDDLHKLYAARITASMQPTHATSDMRWAEDRLGKARLAGAYAWRTVLDDGTALAFGSDAPVEDVRPAWGLYAAITRQDHDGQPPGGWTPNQRLTIAEALRSFARDAAWAVNLERHAGAMTPGMFFDASLFDVDAVADKDPKAWLAAKPVGTVVSGALRAPTP